MWRSVCVCPDGVGLTCRAYPGGPLSGSDSTGGCTPARPAAQTSTAADSAPTLLRKKLSRQTRNSQFRFTDICLQNKKNE